MKPVVMIRILSEVCPQHRHGGGSRGASQDRSRLAVLDPAGAAKSTRATERLREHARTSPAHLIAHHYVRYLGDRSGGLLVGKSVAATYGLGDAYPEQAAAA